MSDLSLYTPIKKTRKTEESVLVTVGETDNGITGKEITTNIPLSGDTNITANGIDVSSMNSLFVSFDVTVNDLDAFIIQARPHVDAAYVTLFNQASEYTPIPTGLLQGTSGDLTTQAAGSTGWFIMDVSGIDSVNLQVSGTVANTTDVTTYWSAN